MNTDSSSTVTIPAIDTSIISAGLYELSRLLGTLNPGGQSHGLRGGEFGYGQEHKNDVFDMFPYHWGDCECGFDELVAAWDTQNPHADTCYQTALQDRGWDEAEQLAAEHNLPVDGCFRHCTCGVQAAWEIWAAEHDHDPACPVIRPNFKHHETGFEVRWYKYIGRNMETSKPVDLATWLRILTECTAATIAAFTNTPTPPVVTDDGNPDCYRCAQQLSQETSDPVEASMLIGSRMYLCPTCGNKRCPTASDHRLSCTGSNEPGQAGSRH